MKRWEYMILIVDSENTGSGERYLDQFGADGWELVSVIRRTAKGAETCAKEAYMKREIAEVAT